MARSANVMQVILACETCKSRNYKKRRRRDLQGGRLELRKFCPHCRSHQAHVESK